MGSRMDLVRRSSFAGTLYSAAVHIIKKKKVVECLHCSTLQLTATHYNTRWHTAMHSKLWDTLQHIVTHCISLQLTATHCNTLQQCITLQHTAKLWDTLQHIATHCISLHLTATHCNTLQQCITLQHTAKLWDTLQHIATHCVSLQLTATHCNTLQQCITLQHTAKHCNAPQHTHIYTRSGRMKVPWLYKFAGGPTCSLQHAATHCHSLQHTATHCNTLQHTATHCNTLQHTSIYTPGGRMKVPWLYSFAGCRTSPRGRRACGRLGSLTKKTCVWVWGRRSSLIKCNVQINCRLFPRTSPHGRGACGSR